jgi:hypothetical protein
MILQAGLDMVEKNGDLQRFLNLLEGGVPAIGGRCFCTIRSNSTGPRGVGLGVRSIIIELA